jgi:alkaline phosphatase
MNQRRGKSAGVSAALMMASVFAACTAQPSVGRNALSKPSEIDPTTFAAGDAALKRRLQLKPNTGKAKNVILFIGDGMGISTLTAARIYTGQKLGKLGEDHVLAMERLPYSALIKTYNTNLQVADSAGTATAILTGTKTKGGVINIARDAARQNCIEALQAPLDSLAQQAAAAGLSTGVVSTARITHATPAVMYAHSADRNWEQPKDIPAPYRQAGCTSIAEQLIYADHGLDVVLGGGARAFDTIVQDWPGTYASALPMLKSAPADKPVLGLFAQSHLPYRRLRPEDTPVPTLEAMTRFAIERLSGNPSGYFLMVEAGRIDHGHHAGKAELALEEAFAFDKAIQAALEMIDLDDTLVLVTADHSHVLTMAGYPARGNPILGVVKGTEENGEPSEDAYIAPDGKPYTTLGYHNGPGAQKGVRDPRTRPGEVIHQVAAIGSYSETHGGEDVALLAAGPAAYLVGGVLEQHVIYHIMHHALRLPPTADLRKASP